MSKSNSSFKFFKNINNSINSLLEKNLNKLKINNLINLAKSNKIFLSIVALVILFLSYLSIPNIYNQDEISKELKKDLFNDLQLEVNFSKKLKYKFLPKPHFESTETSIIFNQTKVSEIKKIKIYVSLENLYSLKKMNFNEIVLEDANFNLNKKNYNFFTELLNQNFASSKLKINNSNIFFRNFENEVLFINNIINAEYFYDKNELKNIFYSENKIFNLPYSLKLFNNQIENKIYSKLNVDLLKLQIENEHFYNDEIKLGDTEFIFNKLKGIAEYKTNKAFFEFKLFDKLEDKKFSYNGKLNFKPFYSYFKGSTKELNYSYLFSSYSIFSQLLKNEIFNSKNIDFEFNLKADKLKNSSYLSNIFLNLKIQEGLTDLDNSILSWKDCAIFETTNSLIYIKDGQLILDGTLKVNIIDHNKIFQYLLTPKNFRKKISKIDLNYSFNFDAKTVDIKDIKIDNKFDQNVNKILNNVILKKENFQNKIYFKNLLNEAIKNYDG